jgi:hypothetical protein
MAPYQLSEEQNLLLQTIFDYFHKVGEWPTWTYVLSKVQARVQSSVVDLASSLWPRYVCQIPTFSQGNDWASITIEGIHECQGSNEELGDFIRMLGLCASIYFDPTISQPEVSSLALRQHLALSDLAIDKMHKLIAIERIFTEGSGILNEWQYQISPEIRRYYGVTSIADYLDRHPIPQVPEQSIAPEDDGHDTESSVSVPAEPPDLTYDYLWVGGFLHDSSRPHIGGPLSQEDQKPLHPVFSQFLVCLATEMERIGISPRICSPFPDFSYLLGLTSTHLYIVIGPSLGMRLAVFKDLRGINPAHTLDEVTIACTHELIWEQKISVEISLGDLDGEEKQKYALQLIAREAAEQMTLEQTSIIPASISDSLKRFREDHPNPAATCFIIMSFEKTRAHQQIAKTIKDTLSQHGLEGVRADEKEYSETLHVNILTYMYGCDFAIAVFDRLTSESFNPNVAYEIGYMAALSKPVCLLKDKTLGTLHADLGGHLYKLFDPQNIRGTLPAELTKWLRDHIVMK